MMYSIPIHPRAGIGYCFVVDVDNPQHALSVLSYEIRQCLKAGVDAKGDTSYNHLRESLRILRKPWRTTANKGFSQTWIVNKIEVVPVKAMKVSYDTPLIPVYYENGSSRNTNITMTSNHHGLKLEILPRRKPLKHSGNQGPIVDK